MRRWLALACAALACAAIGGASGWSRAAAAPNDPQNIVSDSYYKFDVANGQLSVVVKATVQNARQADLNEIVLWAMPGSTDLRVLRDAAQLNVTLTPSTADSPTKVTARLDRPLKARARLDIEMRYVVANRTGKEIRIEPGIIAVSFVGQGQGSFVFADVPKDGDNYFEPGCLKVGDQPADVAAAGAERWVCGDAALVAMNQEDPAVIKQCTALDDRCRQKLIDTPYSAYAQSVTDLSLVSALQADVNLMRGPVKVVLKYFRRDADWATRQFEVAKAALPLLEATFGFPYPRDTLLMRESYNIEFLGFAGLAFPESGEVLVSTGTGVDDEVTVHELAHQWAGANLETAWLWEGLAEYGTRVVAPSLGIKPRDWRWDSFGFSDPLATWHNGSKVTQPNYWYGKAGAFWFEFEKAVGGRDMMHRVLERVDDNPKRLPLDGGWFMNQGEWTSGANLETLFLTWVWNPDTAKPLLAQRRAANNLVQSVLIRAAQWGIAGMPTDIFANLDAWNFAAIAQQADEAHEILDDYEAVIKLSAAASLPQSHAVADAWPNSTLAAIRQIVRDQRQAVAAIQSASSVLAGEPEDSGPRVQLDEARARYESGDFQEAERLASTSVTRRVSSEAAVKLVELAGEKQRTFHANFAQMVGLLGKDPDADVRRAQEALAAGRVEDALRYAHSAHSAWDGAQGQGFIRLGLLTGLMCALSLGVWWGMQKLDRSGGKASVHVGYELDPAEERRAGWRDWDNSERL